MAYKQQQINKIIIKISSICFIEGNKNTINKQKNNNNFTSK